MYANDCHIDVVPHLVLENGRQVVVKSDEDKLRTPTLRASPRG